MGLFGLNFALSTFCALKLTFALGEDVALSLVQLRASSSSNASQLDGAGQKRPHIVFVLADDLGWNAVGYHGTKKTQAKTPNVDQLARNGIKLESYYVGPYCAPSRFAFLTGRSAWKSEAGYNNFRDDTPIGTDLSYKMLPMALREAGYKTHIVGKWHQGFHRKEYLPTSRGFDTAFGILTGCTDHFTQKVFGNGNSACELNGKRVIDIHFNGGPATTYVSGSFGDDLYRRRALKLIHEHDVEKPFFLYLSLQMPHEPFQTTLNTSSRYSLSEDENQFWGMHSHMDDTVEAVVDALKEKTMWKDTLLIFTSDNGAEGERSLEPFAANYPLRGHKGLTWEGGIRVPCIVSGGFIPDSVRGTTLNEITAVEDWYAIFARLAGAKLDWGGRKPMDSTENWDYIIGEQAHSNRFEVIHNYFGVGVPAGVPDGELYRMSVIRRGNYKAVTFGTSNEPCNGCRRCSARSPCIYNVDEDPGETTDIAQTKCVSTSANTTCNPGLIDYFKTRLEASWKEAYAQPFFGFDKPGNDEDQFNTACAEFKNQGGYLMPWATEEDESAFTRREFKFKLRVADPLTLTNVDHLRFTFDLTD